MTTSGLTIFGTGVSNALGTDIATGAQTNGVVAQLRFDGLIEFSAPGSTFGMTARCVTSSSDTWTLEAGSYLDVMPVT
jgi:hypothetical protein